MSLQDMDALKRIPALSVLPIIYLGPGLSLDNGVTAYSIRRFAKLVAAKQFKNPALGKRKYD